MQTKLPSTMPTLAELVERYHQCLDQHSKSLSAFPDHTAQSTDSSDTNLNMHERRSSQFAIPTNVGKIRTDLPSELSRSECNTPTAGESSDSLSTGSTSTPTPKSALRAPKSPILHGVTSPIVPCTPIASKVQLKSPQSDLVSKVESQHGQQFKTMLAKKFGTSRSPTKKSTFNRGKMTDHDSVVLLSIIADLTTLLDQFCRVYDAQANSQPLLPPLHSPTQGYHDVPCPPLGKPSGPTRMTFTLNSAFNTVETLTPDVSVSPREVSAPQTASVAPPLGITPKRRATVHFKDTGAFMDFTPLESTQNDDAMMMSQSEEAMPNMRISRLLQRKSVVMNNKLQRCQDQAGMDMVNDFLILDEVGQGAAGTVYVVLDTRTSAEFAMKEIKRQKIPLRHINHSNTASLVTTGSGGSSSAPDSLHREIALMKKLRHDNICRLHEVIDDPETQTIFLIMDYVPGGRIAPDLDLMTGKCTPLSVPKMRHYLQQIVSGLSYLHRHSIVHRDLKPDNILIDDRNDRVVLVDFGVSVEEEDGTVSGFAGTPAFIAPEVWTASSNSNSAIEGKAADIWSLGVTVYMLLFGCSPFPAMNTRELEQSIKYGEVKFPEDFQNEHWRDLLRKMLTKNPAERIKVRGIRKHPALDAEELPDSNLANISPAEVHHAITTRRQSVLPDSQAMQRASLSLADSSNACTLPPIFQ